MIDVREVLRSTPKLTTFWSVEQIHALVETLRAGSSGTTVEVVGSSEHGIPIHHVRFGHGSVKALFVGFPHANEPIGSLTVASLLTALHRGDRELLEVDVEWHIVPCIDPDGAILNEGWTQKPFTLERYIRNSHRQELCDQADCSFPIEYKRLVFARPSKEARVLQRVLADVQPDFYYSLHNEGPGGGAWFALTRDIGSNSYGQLYSLLEEYEIPLQSAPPYREWLVEFGQGVVEQFSTSKYYDFLERTTHSPEEILQRGGAASWEYLAGIKGSALTLLTELPLAKHPADGSTRPTEQTLRQLMLRIEADNKYLATVILEEWDRVKDDLDNTSPFHRKVFNGLISVREMLHEGLPSWQQKARDTLFNSAYGKSMTEGERFDLYLFRIRVLCQSYEFVRLLNASKQTARVMDAARRMEAVFSDAIRDIDRAIGVDRFEAIDCDSLARVQLGGGLIVLNAVLESRASSDRGGRRSVRPGIG